MLEQKRSRDAGDGSGGAVNRVLMWRILPVALFLGLVLLFFRRVLIDPGELYGSDAVFYFFPIKQFVLEHLQERGSLPFWNPYVFSGIPFVTNIQASMFYPAGLLYYILPADSAYTWSSVLHFLIGGLSMFALMRTLNLSTASALLSSVLFCFNHFFLAHLYAGHLTFVQAYVWTPLIFLLVHRYMVTLETQSALAAGGVLGIQLLGGFPQISFYTILLILGYGMFNALRTLSGRDGRKACLLVFGLGLTLAVAAGLAAIQLLPTWEFAQLSTRAGGLPYDFATYDSLHPKELLAFFFPDLFGSAVDGTYWRRPEVWHFWETCGYVGLVPLLLVFVRRQDEGWKPVKSFFIIIIVLSLLLALGKHNPLYPWISRLPGFSSFRIPAQIIFLYVFGMSVLAGQGLEGLRKTRVRLSPAGLLLWVPMGLVFAAGWVGMQWYPYDFFRLAFGWLASGSISHADLDVLPGRMWAGMYYGAILFAAGFTVLIARKAQRVSWHHAALLLIFLSTADLYLFGEEFLQPYRYDSAPSEVGLASKLPRSPCQGRVMTTSGPLDTNDSILYRFPSVLGYDPLILRRYVYWVQESQDLRRDDHAVHLRAVARPHVKLMKMLQLRLLVHRRGVERMSNELPYATFVSDRIVRSEGDALHFIKDPGFDPTRSVVLESSADAAVLPEIRGRVHGEFEVTAYEEERIRLRVSVDRPAYMVLSEIYYPGWRARVDGLRVPVLRANYLFRGVPLRRGDHTVELYFTSRPFWVGTIISCATLLLIAGTVGRGWRRRTGAC